MDGYSWIALLTVLAALVAVWNIHKRKEYTYSLLDTSGVILNTVLIFMVYPPLCVVGLLVGATAEPVSVFLKSIAVAMGRLMPAVSVAGVAASVILRRKERPGISFLVQFAGGAWFCITMMLGKLSGCF